MKLVAPEKNVVISFSSKFPILRHVQDLLSSPMLEFGGWNGRGGHFYMWLISLRGVSTAPFSMYNSHTIRKRLLTSSVKNENTVKSKL